MDENNTHEFQVGNITFHIISHFKETGGTTIDSTLIKLMEQEKENLLIDIDSS